MENDDIVRCYSACVIIFYGGVSRYTSDNNDYRYGFRKDQNIPVIGVHRPYYEQNRYSALSPSEAKKKYLQLENTVREYMHEMGAPTSIIDRMFRKASNEVDLIPSDKFKEFYHSTEPFIDEWLIARCGGYGPLSALSNSEQTDYQKYNQALKHAIDNRKIKSSKDHHDFTPRGMALEYIKQLKQKIHTHNSKVMACQKSAIVTNQEQWAGHYD